MCGIVGGMWLYDGSDIEKRLKASMLCMNNRGPDDSDSVVEPLNERRRWGYALGHTRLSVIDLSEAGRQPMSSDDGRYTLVYNGEIYNYLEIRKKLESLEYNFRSDTDTEVLLMAWMQWGENVLTQLTGMFSFAIIDRCESTLTCVRDFFGIKPLVYFHDTRNKEFYFSSSIRSLIIMANIKPKLNWQKAYDYLVLGTYDNDEKSMIEGICHLPPAHLLQMNLNTMEVIKKKQYWSINIEHQSTLTFAQASEKLRSMFLRNVELHLRSDVPVGIALSGGLDSSSIACAIRYLYPDMDIHTFSYIAKGSSKSEEYWVDLVNKHVCSREHKVFVSMLDLQHDLDDMIFHQEEPFGSTSIYAQYRVFKLAKECGVTVTLDGQGADELLAGYHGYPGERLRSLVETHQYQKAVSFLYEWSKWPDRNIILGLLYLGESYLNDEYRGYFKKLIGKTQNPSWIHSEVLKERGVVFLSKKLRRYEHSKGRCLSAALSSALTRRGVLSLLRHGDRNSMRFSIESRVPFLTADMAEFVLSLPEDYLISLKGETKSIFREAMRDIVPDELLKRKDKIGFETPEKDLLFGFGDAIFDYLEGMDNLVFLNSKRIRQQVELMLESRLEYDKRIWRLINFVRWVELNSISVN